MTEPTVEEVAAAFAPFLDIKAQCPQSFKLINPKLDAMTPITVTVTKGQFIAAHAMLRAHLNGEGERGK